MLRGLRLWEMMKCLNAEEWLTEDERGGQLRWGQGSQKGIESREQAEELVAESRTDIRIGSWAEGAACPVCQQEAADSIFKVIWTMTGLQLEKN